MSSVHHECLRRWLVESCSKSEKTMKCRVCNTPYEVTRTNRWLFLSAFSSWSVQINPSSDWFPQIVLEKRIYCQSLGKNNHPYLNNLHHHCLCMRDHTNICRSDNPRHNSWYCNTHWIYLHKITWWEHSAGCSPCKA